MTFIVLIDSDSKWDDQCVGFFNKLPIVRANNAEHARKLIEVAKNQTTHVVFLVGTLSKKQETALAHELLDAVSDFKRVPLILDISTSKENNLKGLGIQYIGKGLERISQVIENNERGVPQEREDYKK